MKKIYIIIMCAWAITFLNGCRTAHGFGEDMENAGSKIQQKTDK